MSLGDFGGKKVPCISEVWVYHCRCKKRAPLGSTRQPLSHWNHSVTMRRGSILQTFVHMPRPSQYSRCRTVVIGQVSLWMKPRGSGFWPRLVRLFTGITPIGSIGVESSCGVHVSHRSECQCCHTNRCVPHSNWRHEMSLALEQNKEPFNAFARGEDPNHEKARTRDEKLSSYIRESSSPQSPECKFSKRGFPILGFLQLQSVPQHAEKDRYTYGSQTGIGNTTGRNRQGHQLDLRDFSY